MKPPPPIRPPGLEDGRAEPSQIAMDTQPAEVGGRERPRSARGGSQGSYAGVVRELLRSTGSESEQKGDPKTANMEWGPKKSNWSSRGWDDRRRR